MSILLGFEIPSGKRVEIPDEGHAAFFGQTQLSGKTTLIEAITYRAPANVKAVAFITKRGEGSFLTGRMIQPYFSEPTNDPEQPLWRWVSAILEASQSRKLRFEESWIIAACESPREAKSLADVHANIKELLEGKGEYYQKTKKKRVYRWIRKPATGLNQGVYTSLKAYFDIVMPQLARMPYTKKLDLRPGLNVMDLREYSMEAQGMVIRSVMEYVYRHERNTRVIVPEAQDFVPQGKNSPVKMACETMVRKGAADKNFMWLDSQDMAAVDKVMLRAVSILGCGVQGEAHEMGRAIAHLFGVATKLTPHDIGTLGIGQFYVRVVGGNVTKVYVQPAWMDSEVHSKAIAMGHEPVSSARQILKRFKEERPAEALREGGPQMLQILDQEVPDGETHTEQRDPGNRSLSQGIPCANNGDAGDQSADRRDARDVESIETEEIMWKEKYEDLKLRFDGLQNSYNKLNERLERLTMASPASGVPAPSLHGNGAASGAKTPGVAPETIIAAYPTFDVIYAQVKERAANDPGILELLAARPEIRVNVQRTVIDLDDATLAGKCARLIANGFFKSPAQVSATLKEIKRLFGGSEQPTTNVRRALDRLNEQGFLTSEADGYKAVPEMKVNIVEIK